MISFFAVCKNYSRRHIFGSNNFTSLMVSIHLPSIVFSSSCLIAKHITFEVFMLNGSELHEGKNVKHNKNRLKDRDQLLNTTEINY